MQIIKRVGAIMIWLAGTVLVFAAANKDGAQFYRIFACEGCVCSGKAGFHDATARRG
jgi:hypothetical protein